MARKNARHPPLSSLTPKTRVGTVLSTDANKFDLDNAVCEVKELCVLANAAYRVLELEKRPRVEANGVRIWKGDYIYDFLPHDDAMRLLRDFDALGEKYGQAEARRRMPAPSRFHLELHKVQKRKPYAPMSEADKERLAGVTASMAAKEEERKAAGLPPSSKTKRYAGVQL